MSDRPTPDTILQEALDLVGPEERAAYLDGVCGKDAALRDEIESLLAAHFEANAFMDTLVDPVWQETASEKEGDRIGRYKLLQQIGEGGFGTVYLAEQTEPVKRRVALKVIKAGMDSKEVIARFEAERQALALMDHPNIAKVHDAGTTEGGRPYFVMELVKGMPLTKYCADKGLDTKSRLELFMDVCAAVQHAHQKGIIHRDLKPSNILVSPHDGKPVVKVIDFGIAKAISMELTEKTIFTQLGRMIGTPQYMSPEQAELNALDVDTRSDIYSLGVVLYELLTGTTPLDGEHLRSAAYGEMQRLIREETPPKPSTRVSTVARQVFTSHTPDSRSLRGDLDWIVMKALEKERDRRYETANGFSSDIRRFLNQEPVSAGPPGVAYKIKKFVRRNRTTVAVAATITFLLVTGIFGTTWFAVSAQQAKEEALRRGKETKEALKETEVALKQSHYEEAKAWLERARLQKSQKNDFAAALMAAKGLGFRGFGAEGKTDEFREANPVYLGTDAPEFAKLTEIGMSGGLSYRPIWRSPVGAHRGDVVAVAFSPDGAILASGSFDGIVKLWDVSTGKLIHTLKGHRSCVTELSFSPDGATLASGSYDETAKLWQVSTGKLIRTLNVNRGLVLDVAFSPDGRTLACGCYDSTIQFWDVSTGGLKGSLTGHTRHVVSVAYSPDGTTLASGSYDNTVKLWNIATGKEIRSLEGHIKEVRCVAFSPDGTILASGAYDNRIKLWDVSTGAEIRSLQGHQNGVCGLAFSPDGSTLVSGSRDNTTRLWDIATGKETHLLTGHGEPVISVAFSPDGTVVANGSDDDTFHLWDVSAGKQITSLKGHADVVTGVAIHPACTILASGSEDGTIKLWNLSDGTATLTLGGHRAGITSVAFSPDGTMLATGSHDKTIKLWDVSTGKEIHTLMGHVREVSCLAFSPDGAALASGSWGGKIKIWDTSTGKESDALEMGGGEVKSVAFSPDGTLLASGSDDKTIKLWDVPTWKIRHSFQAHRYQVLTLNFSPNSSLLASGSEDGSISLWETQTRKLALHLEGHDDSVRSVAFSPDGANLASGGQDGAIKLWDVSNGIAIISLRRHGAGVTTVAFSPDGNTLASGSADKTVKLWSVAKPPIDLAAYIDPENPWCRLEGSRMSWNRTPGNRIGDGESEFVNSSPDSLVGILRSTRSRKEKDRDLFWAYIHAHNLGSARVMLPRLSAPEDRKIAIPAFIRMLDQADAAKTISPDLNREIRSSIDSLR